MGFLEDVPSAATPPTPQTARGGFLDAVPSVQDSFAPFRRAQLEHEVNFYQKKALESLSFSSIAKETARGTVSRLTKPFRSFLEGFKAYEPEEKTLKGAFVEGEPVKTGGEEVSRTIEDTSVRFRDTWDTVVVPMVTTKETPTLSKAVSVGRSVLGVVNVFFSPVTGSLKGLSTVPGVGHLADLLNATFSGLGVAGGTAALDALNAAPVSDETKAKLTPLIEELGALAAQIAAGKATHVIYTKYKGRVSDVLDVVKEEATPKAEPTPAEGRRTLRVVSDGKETKVPVTTPTTRHRAYADRMGYEPYTPDAQLPTIPFGRTPKRGTSADAVTEVVYLPREEVYAVAPKEIVEAVKDAVKGARESNVQVVSRETVPPTAQEATIDSLSAITMRESPPPSSSKPSPRIGEPQVERGTPAATVPPITEMLKPVSGPGEVRAPTLAQRGAALAGTLERTLGQLPVYGRQNWSAQASLAERFIKSSPDEAWEVGMGAKEAPPDLLRSSVWVALTEMAKRAGDTEAIMALAKSPVTEFLTRAGQEAGYLSTFAADNPVRIIKDIEQTWAESFKKRTGQDPERATRAEMVNIDKAIEKSSSSRPSWEQFMKDIQC